MKDSRPIDLFTNQHENFLREITRAWAVFEHGQGILELYLECQEQLPPHWITEMLRIGVTDLEGHELIILDLDWTDIRGTMLRAETWNVPPYAIPERGRSDAPIGDFIFYAGESEKILPNLSQGEPLSDHDPRDDRFP